MDNATKKKSLVFSYITADNSLSKALCDALRWEYDKNLPETKANKSTTSLLRRFAKINMVYEEFKDAMFSSDNINSIPTSDFYIPPEVELKTFSAISSPIPYRKKMKKVCNSDSCQRQIKRLKRENTILKKKLASGNRIKLQIKKKFRLAIIRKTCIKQTQ